MGGNSGGHRLVRNVSFLVGKCPIGADLYMEREADGSWVAASQVLGGCRRVAGYVLCRSKQAWIGSACACGLPQAASVSVSRLAVGGGPVTIVVGDGNVAVAHV